MWVKGWGGGGLGLWEQCWGWVGGRGDARRDGEGAKSPWRVRNVAVGGPLTRPATPGQVCPLEQNKDISRSSSVLASGVCTHSEHHLHESTPRSETLQPTSPGVCARGAENARRNRDNCIPGQRCPPPRTLPDDERPSSCRPFWPALRAIHGAGRGDHVLSPLP